MYKKMESKYYTPDISEFFFGFEYETKIPVIEYPKEKTGWESVIFDGYTCLLEDSFYDEYGCAYDSIQEDIEKKRIRVKYLDKEDIESLGFEYRNTNGMCYWYDYKGNINNLPGGYKVYSSELKHDPDRNTVKIVLKVEGTDEVFFEGFIKNKSELIRLLIQLGIS